MFFSWTAMSNGGGSPTCIAGLRRRPVSGGKRLFPMKLNRLVFGVTVCVTINCVSACGKKQSPAEATPPAQAQQPTVQQPAQQPASRQPAMAAPMANPATQSPNDTDLIQRIMARSAYLVQQKKFAEARLTLSQLDAMALTPGQQTAANNLKAQIPANQ
jgi:hypothetical protein